jgi:outer membrane protein
VLAGYAVTSASAAGVRVTPLVNVPPGTITTSGSQIAPSLAVEWLLFDFGGRDAALKSAAQLSFAANVSFNLTHQKLIFDVAAAYFQYSAARAQTRINSEALDNARLVQTAAEARLGQGISTTMEVAQAKQQVAQAEFDLTQATGGERASYSSLLAAMGILPTAKMKVRDVATRSLPRAVPRNLDTLITDSLQRRPDVQAAFARVKAGKQGIAAAEAEFLPKVALTGTVNRAWGSTSLDDTRFGRTTLSTDQPNAAIMFGIRFPIFDGGMRKSRLEAAEARAAASEQDFAQLQSEAARQIVVAYDALRTGLSGHAAASELVKAARTNYEAALEYFKNGLGTLSEISVTQTGLLKALYAEAQARSNVFGAAATLAFATGQLTNAGVP